MGLALTVSPPPTPLLPPPLPPHVMRSALSGAFSASTGLPNPARLLSAVLLQVRTFPLFRNQTRSTETRITALSRALWDSPTSLVPSISRLLVAGAASRKVCGPLPPSKTSPSLICLHRHLQRLRFAQECPEAPGAAGTDRSSCECDAGSRGHVGASLLSERPS